MGFSLQGFPCWEAQVLGSQGSVAAARRLGSCNVQALGMQALAVAARGLSSCGACVWLLHGM